MEEEIKDQVADDLDGEDLEEESDEDLEEDED
jgi:hypothetical protein